MYNTIIASQIAKIEEKALHYCRMMRPLRRVRQAREIIHAFNKIGK